MGWWAREGGGAPLTEAEREARRRVPASARPYVWAWAGAVEGHEGRAAGVEALSSAALGDFVVHTSANCCPVNVVPARRRARALAGANESAAGEEGSGGSSRRARRAQAGEDAERIVARKIYEAALFVPCMQGQINVDSFRVTEVLEVGGLPVLSSTEWIEAGRYTTAEAYFAGVFGAAHPLPVAFDYGPAGAPALMRDMIAAGPAALEATRAFVADWWAAHKWSLRAHFARLIAEYLD